MLVVDASALVELLLRRAGGESVARHVTEHRGDLHAPHLLDVEILSALRRLDGSGAVTTPRATETVVDYLDLPVERYPHTILVPRIWELRDNFSAYDATYVALAEALTDDGVPLLTSDARLAKAARRHTDVEVLLAA
jgi:predicted nucleic acid-binding protein